MDVVCGAGGFIGGHLVGRLLAEGRDVRAVDIKPTSEWFQFHSCREPIGEMDLSDAKAAEEAIQGADMVWNLAADMGGIGFIQNNKSRCMLNVLINTHLLLAAQRLGVPKFMFASSACVYPADAQRVGWTSYALKESDAYPAMPEDGYGWEKLFSERMCRNFYDDDPDMCIWIPRFHNAYGPFGTWKGGREKAPAAICRKVCAVKHGDATSIEVWGDGKQRRSFIYIDDLIEGMMQLEADPSTAALPINLGSAEMVTIDMLVDIVAEIAGASCPKIYDRNKPQGVFGRSSDNTLIRELTNWEPSTSLRAGIAETYEWVEREYLHDLKNRTEAKL